MRRQAILLVSALTGMAVSLVSTIIAGRYAGDAAFALYALVAAFLSIARDMTDLGTTAVAVRAATHDPAAEKLALENLLAWRIVVAGLLAAGCLGFATLQPDADGMLVLAATAVVILGMHSNGLVAAFQLRGRLDRPALIHIAAQLLALAATAGVMLASLPGRALAIVLLARELVIVVANRWLVRRTLGYMPGLAGGSRRVRALMAATSLYAGAALLFHLMLNSGTFVIRLLAPDAAFNGYAAAFRLITPAFSLAWIMAAPLVPLFSRAALGGDGALERQAGGALLLAAGGSAVLAAAGALLAPDLLDLIYAGRFNAPATSAPLALQWLMVGFVGVAVVAVRAPALLAAGDDVALLRLAAGAFAVTAAGQLLLVPGFGAAGAAAATALGAIFGATAPLGARAAQLPATTALAVVMLPALAVAAGLWLVPVASGPLRILWGTGLSAAALATLWHLPQIVRARSELQPQTDIAARA